MRYGKPALSIPEQVAHLQRRGMNGDPDDMARRLESVNYYRLSAYWHTLRVPGEESFRPGTDFATVWGRYTFDRELRLLVLDAVERFEVAVRTRLALEHTLAFGPFGYLQGEGALFRDDAKRRDKLLAALERALKQSHQETFIEHFQERYAGEHRFPPLWMLVEILSFGDVVTIYRGAPPPIRRRVADFFGLADPVLDSWLLTVNVVRNIAAHHARLWNRELRVRPKVPRQEAWHRPIAVPNERIFIVLTLLADTLRQIAPGSRWSWRVRDLVAASPGVPAAQMGFPDDWTRCAVWTRAWELAERPI